MARKETSEIVNIEAARKNVTRLLDRIMPDSAFRKSALKALADSILFANNRNPNSWSINIDTQTLALYMNIEHRVGVWIEGPSKHVKFHVYLASLNTIDRQQLEAGGAIIYDNNDGDRWSQIGVNLPDQENLIHYLRSAHEAYLANKAKHDIHSGSKAPHFKTGVGVIEFMRDELGLTDLPQPAYVPAYKNTTGKKDSPNMNSVTPFMPINPILDSLKSSGLHYTPWQVATFYTALQTKGFVILSGISGTGKTKLAQAFARLMPQPTALTIIPDNIGRKNSTLSVATKTDANPENYLFLSVRPDWRDSKSLLGFYNPIEQEYQSTQFLEFIRRARHSFIQKEDLIWFVVLDEMNLARVEYYFADLLSVLESGRDENGFSCEPIRLDYPTGLDIPREEREVHLPPNLYFIGTVNIDETTHSFSPKVLDRAFTLELTEADFSQYPPIGRTTIANLSIDQQQSLLNNFTRHKKYAIVDKTIISNYVQNHPEFRDALQSLKTLLQPYDMHFGYRVFDEIVAFLANSETNQLYKEMEPPAKPFDAAILMKILPKFHGSRSKLEEPLKVILAWCLDRNAPTLEIIDSAISNGQESVNSIIHELGKLPYQYPFTANRVIRMLRALYLSGFAAFG